MKSTILMVLLLVGCIAHNQPYLSRAPIQVNSSILESLNITEEYLASQCNTTGQYPTTPCDEAQPRSRFYGDVTATYASLPLVGGSMETSPIIFKALREGELFPGTAITGYEASGSCQVPYANLPPHESRVRR